MSNFDKHTNELMGNPEFKKEMERRQQAEKNRQKEKADREYQSLLDRDNYMEEAYGYDGPFGD